MATRDSATNDSDSAGASNWERQESIVVPVARDVAWAFWANMSNHEREPGVEIIEIDGPFVTGTKGRTITADGRQEWELTDVREHE